MPPRLLHPAHLSLERAPPDLTELVSKLPMKHILALPRSITTSPWFRSSAAQRHPDLRALMRWSSHGTVRGTVFDPVSNAWTGFDLRGFPASSGDHGDQENSLYAHDRGLVCFVPPSRMPVLVTNPLTGEWRTLPVLEHKKTLAVQLLVEDSGVYKVKLVCSERRKTPRREEEEARTTKRTESDGKSYRGEAELWERGFRNGGFRRGTGDLENSRLHRLLRLRVHGQDLPEKPWKRS